MHTEKDTGIGSWNPASEQVIQLFKDFKQFFNILEFSLIFTHYAMSPLATAKQ